MIFGLFGCGESTEQPNPAEAEVERFHRLWNADEFKPIYDDAHISFRDSQTADVAVANLERMKQSYGQFKNSTKRSSTLTATDLSVTDLTVNYDSVYDRGSAVEVFVYRITGDRALLLNYEILSSEAAKKRDADKKPR